MKLKGGKTGEVIKILKLVGCIVIVIIAFINKVFIKL